MFVHVKSFVLDAGGNAKTVQLLDTVEEDEATGGSPEVNDEDTESFSSEEAPAMTIKGSVARREQASQQCSEDTADTVNAGGADRIIDVKLVVDELNAEYQHCAADKTDDDCAHG